MEELEEDVSDGAHAVVKEVHQVESEIDHIANDVKLDALNMLDFTSMRL